jgi:hypothetical protein
VEAAKYDLANQLLYNPILALVKASIVFFLWRLQDRRKVIRWSLVSFFILNLGLAIATFVADLCQCTIVSPLFISTFDGKVVLRMELVLSTLKIVSEE